MITREELLNKLATGAAWSAGVTFKRSNPVPLDKSSIFASLDEAKTYAQTSGIAYPGQTLAVLTEAPEGQAGNVTLYIVTADKSSPELALKEVGSKTLGDNASISLAEDGTLSLYGFADATDGYLPQKKNGKIAWIAISEIVQGDGNTVTSGDEKSVHTEGDEKALTASLVGFSTAEQNFIPYKDVDGSLKWKAEYDGADVKADVATLQGYFNEDGAAKKAADAATLNGKADTAFADAKVEGYFDATGKAKTALDAEKLGGALAADYAKNADLKALAKKDKVAKSDLDEALTAELDAKAVAATVNEELAKKALATDLQATEAKAEQNKTDIATANANIKTINDDYLKAIAFDEATSKFTFTTNVAGQPVDKVVDLNLASVIKSFDYDADTQELVLKDAEWKEDMSPEEKAKHETRVKVSALIDTYTGVDGTTIKVDVAKNQISAEVKAGTIDSTKLAEAVNADIAKGVDAQTRVEAVETSVASKADNTEFQTVKSAVNDPDSGLAATKAIADQNKLDIAAINKKPGVNISQESIAAWDAEKGAKDIADANKLAIEDSVTGLVATKKIADAAAAKALANEGKITALEGNAASSITEEQIQKWDAYETGKENKDTAKTLISQITDTLTGAPSASQTITAFDQVDGKVTATFGDINIAESQVDGLADKLSGLRTDVDTKQTESEVNALIAAATIQQSKVDGLTDALAKKVDVDPNARLMTNAEGKSLADLVALKPAEAGAQVNKIESIKANGTALQIAEDKSVDIPKAMAATFGLVKLGAEFDESADALTIKTVNVNKLEQSADDWLILDGGNSSLVPPKKP